MEQHREFTVHKFQEGRFLTHKAILYTYVRESGMYLRRYDNCRARNDSLQQSRTFFLELNT